MNKQIIPAALIIILIISIISGCGGGGTEGVMPSVNDNNEVDSQSPEGNPIADPAGDSTGAFKIKIKLPEKNITSSDDLSASVIPEGYHTLRVIIDPEALETDITEDLDVSSGGTFELTVNNVPVGSNIATIQILNSSGTVTAQRKHGFFMMAGAVAGPSGTLTLGVGIEGDGSCNPSEIYIPQGTTLFYENHDEVNNRTVTMNSNAVFIGPVSHVTVPADDYDNHVFHSESHLFDMAGTYNYDTGSGSPGRVVVYDTPEITSITDINGDAWDGDPNSTEVDFTINGNDFGADRNVVEGEVTFYKTYEWESVGNTAFSAGEITYPSLAIDSGGTPYVAYREGAYSNKAVVMKYTGNGVNGWEPVGSTAGFSDGEVTYTSLFIYNDVPYVAYKDIANGSGATVMKFNGTAWETVGSAGFSPSSASYTRLYVYDETPYVLFRDEGDSNKARVMKYDYDVSSWVTVGNGTFSTGYIWNPSLYVYEGTPYVSYVDGGYDHKATVMRFNGAAWEIVGSPGFSDGNVDQTSLKIYNGTPYIGFRDEGNGNKATVMKYDGSSWVYVGMPLFSEGGAHFTSLDIYNGELYLAFRDDYNDYCATVMKYDGTAWSTVGSSAFSAGAVIYTSLCVYDGTPYIAYTDGGIGNHATVMKFSKEMKAITPDEITNWQNETIEGNITIPAGKYRVEVTARGDNSTDDIYYGKGTGTYFSVIAE